MTSKKRNIILSDTESESEEKYELSEKDIKKERNFFLKYKDISVIDINKIYDDYKKFINQKNNSNFISFFNKNGPLTLEYVTDKLTEYLFKEKEKEKDVLKNVKEITERKIFKANMLEKKFLDSELESIKKIKSENKNIKQEDIDNQLLKNYKEFIKNVKYFKDKFEKVEPNIEYIKNRINEYKTYELDILDYNIDKFINLVENIKDPKKLLIEIDNYFGKDEIKKKGFYDAIKDIDKTESKILLDTFKKYVEKFDIKKENFLKAIRFEKNPDILIDKFQKYIDEDPKLKIKFTGKKINVDYIKFLISSYFYQKENILELNNINNLINFINNISDDIEKRDLIDQLSIFLKKFDISSNSDITDVLENIKNSDMNIVQIKKMLKIYKNDFFDTDFQDYVNNYIKRYESDPSKFQEEEMSKKLFNEMKNYIYDDYILVKFIIRKILKSLPNDELISNNYVLLNEKNAEIKDLIKLYSKYSENNKEYLNEFKNLKIKLKKLYFEYNEINIEIKNLKDEQNKFIDDYRYADYLFEEFEENEDTLEYIKEVLKKIIAFPVPLIRRFINGYNVQFLKDFIPKKSFGIINPIEKSAYQLFFEKKILDIQNERDNLLSDLNKGLKKIWEEHRNYTIKDDENNILSYGDKIYKDYMEQAENDIEIAYQLFYEDNIKLNDELKKLDLTIKLKDGKFFNKKQKEIEDEWDKHKRKNDEIYKEYNEIASKYKLKILNLDDFYKNFINTKYVINYLNKDKKGIDVSDIKIKPIIKSKKLIETEKNEKIELINYIKKYDYISKKYIDATIRTPDISILDIKKLKEKKQEIDTGLIGLSQIKNGPIDDKIKFMAKNKLSNSLLKVIDIDEYKINSEYISRIIEELVKSSKNVEDFTTKLFNIIVYLNPQINSFIPIEYVKIYQGNTQYLENIKNVFYEPEILINLSPNEKILNLFDNIEINDETKNIILKQIDLLLKNDIDNFVKDIYLSKKEPYILWQTDMIEKPETVLFEKYIDDNGDENYYVYYIEENIIEDTVIYRDLIKVVKYPEYIVYKFTLEKMLQITKDINSINPISKKEIPKEYIKNFYDVYRKEIKKEEEIKLEPIEPLIPNLLDIINDELSLIENDEFIEILTEIKKEKDIEKVKISTEIEKMTMEDIKLRKKYKAIIFDNPTTKNTYILFIDNITGILSYAFNITPKYDIISTYTIPFFLDKNLIKNHINIKEQLEDYKKSDPYYLGNIYIYIYLKEGDFKPINNDELKFNINIIIQRLNVLLNKGKILKPIYLATSRDKIENEISTNTELYNKKLVNLEELNKKYKEFISVDYDKETELNILKEISDLEKEINLLKKNIQKEQDQKLNIIKEEEIRLNNLQEEEIRNFISSLKEFNVNTSSKDDVKNIRLIFNENNEPVFVYDKSIKYDYDIEKDKDINTEYKVDTEDISDVSDMGDISDTDDIVKLNDYISFFYEINDSKDKYKYFIIFRKDPFYISCIYDILNKKIIDKDDNKINNSILYENILKINSENLTDDEIKNQLEEYLKNQDNIYAYLYLNKKKLFATDSKDIDNYIKMIDRLNPEKEYIDRYINNIDPSSCIKDINNIKVKFILDNNKYEPIFEYKDKNSINIDCLKNKKEIDVDILNNKNDDILKKEIDVDVLNNKNDDILKIENDDVSKNEKKEHNYDEFKCYYCQMIPKDKSIKTIILDNKKESKTIYFCSFKCFESEENVFKKYDK